MKVIDGHSLGSFLAWTLAVHLILHVTEVYTSDGTKSCKLLTESEWERKILDRLEPLTKKNFTVKTENGTESYTYVFQLCGDAGGIPGAGVIQMDHNKTTVIGTYSLTQAIGGTDWVFLIYGSETGDDHCPKEKKKTMIMISCNRNTDMGTLQAVQEDRGGNRNCMYVFQLPSSAVCPALQSQLSTGSILLIIGFTLLAVYLIGGFLYQRLIVGAKGMEQFPNYAFWVEVGNLAADGCDFVCRSRNRDEAPAYRGVSSEPLDEEPEERDDHLLPM